MIIKPSLVLKIVVLLLVFIVFTVSLSRFAYADARFMGLEELVAVSDVIAVIEVTKSERIEEQFDNNPPQKRHCLYTQQNIFRFIEFIKVQKDAGLDTGKLHILWAEKTFICARASYSEGKFLVFLDKVCDNEWVTLNHDLGGLAVNEKGDVAGFGFYKGKYGKAVGIKEAKEMILEKTIGGEEVTFETRIRPSLRVLYNVWQEGSHFQKFWCHIEYTRVEEGRGYTKIKPNVVGKWPEGLVSFVRVFIRTDDIRRETYEKIVTDGSTFKITGVWSDGYLYLTSIDDTEGVKIWEKR